MNNKDNYVQRLPIEIILNSKNGRTINNQDGNKFYNLITEITARKDELIIIHLKKAFIPFSFYMLSSSRKNNKLDITEKQTDNTTNSYTITIPDGNYNITELMVKIKNLMETASTFSFIYNITFENATGKVSFLITSGTNALNTTINFATGSNTNSNINDFIGFSNTDITFTTTSSATSDKIVDMAAGLDGLHIKSNLVGTNVITTESGDSGSGELLVIPITLEPYSILYYSEFTNPFKHKLSTSSIRQIEIKITDTDDNIINFNGLPYTFILEAEFVFNPASTLTVQNKTIDNIEALQTRLKTNQDLAKKIINKINNTNIKSNEDKTNRK